MQSVVGLWSRLWSVALRGQLRLWGRRGCRLHLHLGPFLPKTLIQMKLYQLGLQASLLPETGSASHRALGALLVAVAAAATAAAVIAAAARSRGGLPTSRVFAPQLGRFGSARLIGDDAGGVFRCLDAASIRRRSRGPAQGRAFSTGSLDSSRASGGRSASGLPLPAGGDGRMTSAVSASSCSTSSSSSSLLRRDGLWRVAALLCSFRSTLFEAGRGGGPLLLPAAIVWLPRRVGRGWVHHGVRGSALSQQHPSLPLTTFPAAGEGDSWLLRTKSSKYQISPSTGRLSRQGARKSEWQYCSH